MSRIRRLLIANRGEIALRVLRTARVLGIEVVVGCSEADREGLAARLADDVAVLGPASPRESYLSVERIVAAARSAGCDAVHPGYGFLSERAELARAVEEAGLVYVGPTAENIALLGDKLSARRTLSAAEVPVVPGETAPLSDRGALERAASRVGFPLLLKASSGGGGKGIRLVRGPEELAAAHGLASSEARGAFGEGTVFAERWLERARHVEVQVLGDGRGGARVYPERDCSLQRRYQKLLEETPSPGVDAAVRERLLATAARIASLARYRGAGTVEFLLAEDGSFYFLEVNTRLQVEHPITEMVTGEDLVAEQIAIAEGKAFPPSGGGRAEARGAAIELRLNAEDPLQGFRPSTGRVGFLRLPAGPGIRVDSALHAGMEVTPFYDPLLAKVIAWGRDREEARRRLAAACRETWVAGPATTLPLAAPLLEHPAFRSGKYHCQMLEALLANPAFLARPLAAAEKEALAIIAAHLRRSRGSSEGAGATAPSAEGEGARPSAWAREGRTRALRAGPRPSPYDGGRR